MRVLLIEDDEILGDGLRMGIGQLGWIVDWVLDADSAQRALERECFDLDEPCARPRALHRRAVGSSSPVICHGEIEVDPAARSVTVDGVLVPVAPKELAILQELVESRGKTVRRRRLECSISGWKADMASNAVDVHVHHLRRKIPSLTVTTVRGVGFRLD